METEVKKTTLELEAESYIEERENNKNNIGSDFERCKLMNVRAEKGLTNRTPMVILEYLLLDKNERIEDRFFFSQNSRRVGIQRIDDTYYNLTGNRIDDPKIFRSINSIIEKMQEAIGIENYIRQYVNSKGFISYQLKPRDEIGTEVDYDYWDCDTSITEGPDKTNVINSYNSEDLSKLDEVNE